MKDRYRDAIIGLAALLAAAATVLMLVAFGSLREYGRDAVDLEVRFNRAGGLRYGSQITLDGVPIGTIGSVELQIEEALPVLFKCRIDSWARIPIEHEVRVDAALIGGGTRLAIVSLDPSADRALYPSGETPVLAGEFLSLEEALASGIDLRMGPIAESFSEVGSLAATYQALGEELRELVKMGGDDGAGLASTIERANRVLDQATRAFAAASTWLDDEQLLADARSAVFKANLLIERATEAATAAGRLATTLEEESPAIIDRLVGTSLAIDGTLAEVDSLLRRASEGEGTIGRLLSDPVLYEDLDDAAKRLSETLRALRTLIDAIEAEGVKIEF